MDYITKIIRCIDDSSLILCTQNKVLLELPEDVSARSSDDCGITTSRVVQSDATSVAAALLAGITPRAMRLFMKFEYQDVRLEFSFSSLSFFFFLNALLCGAR